MPLKTLESGRSEKCQPNPGCRKPAVRSPLRSRRQWKPPLGICARRCHVKTHMLALQHNWRVRAPLHSPLEWFCTVVSHFDETKLHHRGFCFFTLVYVCFFMTDALGSESPPLCEVGIQLFVTAHLNNEVYGVFIFSSQSPVRTVRPSLLVLSVSWSHTEVKWFICGLWYRTLSD